MLLACLLGVGAPPAVSAAVEPGRVLFTVNGTSGGALTVGQVLARQSGVGETIAVTGQATPDFYNGTTAAETVSLLGIAPLQVTDLRVSRAPFAADGTSTSDVARLVSGTEVADGLGTGPGRRIPALFDASYDKTVVAFHRPLRGAGDDNSREQIFPAGGAPLHVWLTTTGGRLAATADGPSKLASGVAGQFTADADLRPGETPTFLWQFGDGETSTAASPSHTYAADGTYLVSVTVSAGGRSGVAALAQPLTVGDPPTPSTPGGADGPQGAADATGGGGTGAGASGPTKSSGNDARTVAKPTTPRKTTKPRKGQTVPRSADQEASAQDADASTGSGATAGATTGAATPAAPASPASSPPATSPSATTPPSTPRATGEPAPTTPAPAGGSGPTDDVRGLLASATATGTPALREALAAADALAKLPPEQQAPTRAAAGSSADLAGWIGGGVVVFGLLAVGAAREGVRASALLRLP